MDITPIYELQTRLKSAAIAGVNLLQEDFRLKRAIEAIKPLESVSPVFAKLSQQMGQLLSADCSNPAAALLDAISLTDAVVCTLAVVEVKSQRNAFALEHTLDNLIINAPCSKVKGLIEALTTSGSGNYAFVQDMHETAPEIFEDYRVRYALVQALGASYAELADMVMNWLAEEKDRAIIPLLKKGFDPMGKREMVRRVEVIERIAGADENDFYIKMLENAKGDVRGALICALRHEPSNIDLLLNMVKTEKGKQKQMVLQILGYMEDERVYELFHTMAEKKPLDACNYLLPSTTESASRIIAELCMKQLSYVTALPVKDQNTEQEKAEIKVFCRAVEALVGKQGDAACACYRLLLSQKDTLDQLYRIWIADIRQDVIGGFQEIGYQKLQEIKYQKQTWEGLIGYHMAQSLLANPDEKLKQLVMELYGNEESADKNTDFLIAAVVVKIMEAGDCADWFTAQIANISSLEKKEKVVLKDIAKALSFIMWDNKEKHYIVDAWYVSIRWDDVLRKKISNRIEVPDAKGIKDWLSQHGSKIRDAILYKWLDLTDSEECAKYGEYFYKKAFLVAKGDKIDYLTYMRNCGWKKCEGLVVDYIKSNTDNDYWWNVDWYLRELPGDYEAIQKEVNTALELVQSGEIKLKRLDTAQKVEEWVDHIRAFDDYNALRN